MRLPIAALLAALAAPAALAQTEPTLAITNVAVVSGATRADRTVVINGNRIVAIGPANTPVATHAVVLNGSGKFLIPGLALLTRWARSMSESLRISCFLTAIRSWTFGTPRESTRLSPTAVCSIVRLWIACLRRRKKRPVRSLPGPADRSCTLAQVLLPLKTQDVAPLV